MLFSKARAKVTELIHDAVIHYRDDLDLQNLIDYGQREVSHWIALFHHKKTLIV